MKLHPYTTGVKLSNSHHIQHLLCHLRLGNSLLDMTPNVQATTEKTIDKWNYIRIENLYATKDTIKKVKECQQDGKNVLQTIYDKQIYIKNSCNSTLKRQPN